MGSARAARAVFRALAENAERTEQFQTFGRMSCAKRLDARRVQPHPRRVCSPTSVFGLKVRSEFTGLRFGHACCGLGPRAGETTSANYSRTGANRAKLVRRFPVAPHL